MSLENDVTILLEAEELFKPASKGDRAERKQLANKVRLETLMKELKIDEKDWPMFEPFASVKLDKYATSWNNDSEYAENLYELLTVLDKKNAIQSYGGFSTAGVPRYEESEALKAGYTIYVNFTYNYRNSRTAGLYVISKTPDNKYLDAIPSFEHVEDLQAFRTKYKQGVTIDPNKFIKTTAAHSARCSVCKKTLGPGHKVISFEVAGYNNATICMKCADTLNKSLQGAT